MFNAFTRLLVVLVSCCGRCVMFRLRRRVFVLRLLWCVKCGMFNASTVRGVYGHVFKYWYVIFVGVVFIV